MALADSGPSREALSPKFLQAIKAQNKPYYLLMRFAAYAGTSVALAAGTVIRAFYERSNFYSASVAVAQSNASLMILTNLALLGISMFMLGLQRLFYGPLRPIEVEQLYEKAWFAITETCLAMTIFREEVGGWFMVMFVSLLIGKVWGWIGEGRVEILEQQPPANPRLFHTQLSLSLSISSLFDFFMLRYAVNTVLRHARPNMMVMFAFEFAVLTINSLSTSARYGIFVFEANVIRKQMDERRSQIRRDREQAQIGTTRSQTSTGDAAVGTAASPGEEVETMEFDAPGWEEKGRWIFYLDLATDFFKLILYLTFFCVLCMFYGMPIHIIRDVALTIRSFHKRIRDFMRYRQATRDMNKRYPDATAEEVAREDVCIICRETMRAWAGQQNGQHAGNQANNDSTTNRVDERSRPKKLPCGHILHFACLRSWLERQQNCPTCRRPVLVTNTALQTQPPHLQHQQARAHPPVHPNPAPLRGQLGPVAQAGNNPAPPQNIYQFGPIRIAFGARRLPQRPQQNNIPPTNENAGVPTIATPPHNSEPFSGQLSQVHLGPVSTVAQLQQIEQQLVSQIHGLRLQHDQLYLVRALQGELMRLRLLQANSSSFTPGTESGHNQNAVALSLTHPEGPSFMANQSSQIPIVESHVPAGVTIPTGWTLVPLRRLSANTGSNSGETRSSAQRFNEMETRSPRSAPHDAPESSTIRRETLVGGLHDLSPPVESANGHNRTSQRREGPVVNEDSHNGRVDPQTPNAESIEDVSSHSAPGLPSWGSGPAIQGNEAPSSSREGSTDTRDVGSQVAAENLKREARDKGKGKAMTVEDSPEDVD